MTLRDRIVARLGPIVSAALTSPEGRARRRARFEARRRRKGEPHRITVFHQVDDPYSALLAQKLPALAAAHDVVIDLRLVPPPPDWAAPERAQLERYGLEDARLVARAYGVACPLTPPASGAKRQALGILTATLTADHAVDILAEVSARLWDGRSLDAVEATTGRAPDSRVAAVLSQGEAERARLGHYLGATLFHAGEWYWGVDRLGDLEDRLIALGAARSNPPAPAIAPRPELRFIDVGARPNALPPLEAFISLRSPYTWLAMERLTRLSDHYGAPLQLRPILPMAMRGLPVPSAKRLYIVRDAKREAERMGLPFGRICDPLGRPAERGLAVLFGALDSGRGPAFATSFLRGVFAEGIDAGSDRGLRRLCRRAEVDWSEAQDWMADEGWRARAEANRAAMAGHGLWGVPSFVFDDTAAWGQDRLWRIEQAMIERLERLSPPGSGPDPAGP